ncbi:CoA transferase [Rhizobium lusitanum]|uniref:CoA transferase n=1 Tax=Rhizobium lusitanum TaxID=293958 RepID=A0A6L9UA37_9HYPH|nr:CoA transferase [Rhizobium lusitanum]NEI72424.1 CoA transferase [Rhizobium lusitanum]
MVTAKKLPLEGVRVLDLTQFLSGPFGSQVLADLGAEVIKLEGPQGDSSRQIPPHFVAGDSVYYHSVNRNKRSVVVDLKAKEGLEIARELALSCDVVLENFRPSVLPRLGLSAEALRAQKPSLIWCSISGFGQDGPYREKPAYDMIVQALSGGMSLTGEPGGPSVRSGVPIGDLTAGLYAAVAVLAALARRSATGEGDTIDISMLDCQAAMLSYQAAYYLFTGKVPGLQGTGHDSFATYRRFLCAEDTEIVITANTDRMWQGMCRTLGLERLISDPRFLDSHQRHVNRLALWQELEPCFLIRTAQAWCPMLEAEGVPVGVVNTLDQVVTDPQIVHRQMVSTIAATDGRQVRVMGNPIVMDGTREARNRMPPRLGEDTDEVLREVLGYSSDLIKNLASRGSIQLDKAET